MLFYHTTCFASSGQTCLGLRGSSGQPVEAYVDMGHITQIHVAGSRAMHFKS